MGLMGVCAVAFAVLLAVGVWYRIRDDRRMMAAWPSRGAYAWASDWDVRQYHRALLTWLKVEDWRISAATALDADHLLLVICRERYRLPTLILRPGVAPTEADRETLHAAQMRESAHRAIMISDQPSDPMPAQAEDGTAILFLNFEALPYLTQDIDAAFRQISLPVPPEAKPAPALDADGDPAWMSPDTISMPETAPGTTV